MEEKEKASFKDFLVITIISIAIVLIIRTFIAQPFVVSGSSMEPTFNTRDYLIVDQLTYQIQNPQRGQVIVFKYPEIPERFFIKRIIGLPGETVKIEGEDVYLKSSGEDFELLEEPYVEFNKNDFMETTLADDEYFVMGDNRLASLDSRSWGPLKESFIIGKALIRLYPLNEISVNPGN
jgi:signal peptidase I